MSTFITHQFSSKAKNSTSLSHADIARFSSMSLVILLLFSGQFAQAQCSLTVIPTVSGCYSTTAGSRATVSVEVRWQNAPSGQSIVVTGPAGSVPASRTIIPGSYTSTGGNGTIVSPQVVAFEITANAASGLTTSANFSTTTSCSAISASFSAPAACEPTPCSSGQLGGTVFNDFDANGVKSSGETSGLIGVTVRAYDCLGNLVGTATTDVFGKYAFTGLSAGSYPLRVEFTNLPAVYSQGTVNGVDGRTTVQFVDAPNCTVDLGVLDPTDYCEANPKLALPCYVYGDPLPLGSVSGSRDAIVSFDYTLSGVTDGSAMIHMATAAEVGTIWGETYNKYTQTLFMAATLKRHAGLGPLGLGGIYVSNWADPNTPVTTPWLSVTSLTVGGVNINVGSIGVNGAGGRGLPTDPTVSSRDPQAFIKAAKAGIGGIDLSDDGNALFFTNLFDGQLYKVDITAYNTSGTNPTTATAFNVLGSTSCPGGTMRPWATKYYKGNVYVGAVCDAQTSQSKGDLRAFVYKVNPSTGASTVIFDFPLTYPKGFPNVNALSATGWYPWSDNWADKYITAANEAIYPQPILSDLEFDIDGTMILGFGDRNGIQTGYQNYQPTGNSTTQYSGNVGGDILRAYSNGGGTFVLENNAKAGPNIGYGPNNNQGPGFGEYYNDNFFDAGSNEVFHAELAQGGLAVRPGSGEVVAVTVDPVDIPPGGADYRFYTQAGGVRHFNNTTGQTNSGYIVYTSNFDDGTFGKATGLGDVVLRCSTPSFLEIGNRVWLDDDKDGIQDPCEKPLANVKVALYKGNTLIANTTTDANGEYYFSAKSKLTNGTWVGTAADTTLLPTTAYTVRFGTDGTTNQFASNVLTVDNGKYQLTTALSTAPTASTLNDSNPVVTGGFASATVTTGVLGSVNHTIDAGFYCLTTTASVTAIPTTCNGGNVNSNGQVNVTNIQNADKVFLVAIGSPLPSYTAVGSQPVSASAASFTGLSNPTSTSGQSYSVVIYNGPCCYTVLTTTLLQTNCCNLTATVGTPVCNGNTYTVSGTISLTVTPAQAQTLTVQDNGVVQATITMTAGQTTANFSLTGVSNGSSHTATVISSNSICAATATYTAPVAISATLTSATICAGQPVSLTATGGTSYTFNNGTTNTTGLFTFMPVSTTTISVTVGNASGCTSTASATITVNPPPTIGVTSITCNGLTTFDVAFTATAGATINVNMGTLTGNTVTGIPSGQSLFITAMLNSCTAVSGPISQNCQTNAASLGDFVFVDTNKDGIQQAGEPGIPGVVVVLLNGSNTPIASTTTNASGIYSFTGLTPGLPYSVSFVAPTGYTSTSAQVGGDDTKDSDDNPITGQTRSVTLAPGENNPNLDAGYYLTAPKLSLEKLVDKTRAEAGSILSYSIVLTNSGSTTATNVTVRDSSTAGLTYVANSATAPAGTTFTQGTPATTWVISSLAPGQSLTLTFQAKADSSGILYNVATIPGDTAKVCTSVPVHICSGAQYLFRLTASAGLSSYQWYKDGIAIPNATTNVLSVTAAGSYGLGANTLPGQCPDFSCCPFIVVEDTLPAFQAKAISVACTGSIAQANGQIVLSGFNSAYTYQYSLGSTFNGSASLSGPAQSIPQNGVIVSNLANPVVATAYTIRVYNGSGCYTDVMVMLLPTVCGCPANVCVPLVITQTKRAKRN